MKKIFENIFDEIESSEILDADNFNCDICIYLVDVYKFTTVEEVIGSLSNIMDNTDNVNDYIIDEVHLKETTDFGMVPVIKIDGFFDYRNAMRIIKQTRIKMNQVLFRSEVTGKKTFSTISESLVVDILMSNKNSLNIIEQINDAYNKQISSTQKTLDLRHIDVSNCKVIDFSLTDARNKVFKLDIRGWDTSKCEYLSFKDMRDVVEIIGIEDLDISSLRGTSYMFADCRSLPSLDLSKWDFSSIKLYNNMFEDCKYLSAIKFPDNFNMDKAEDCSRMFSYCTMLTGIVNNKWTLRRLKYAENMFVAVDMSAFDTSEWNLSNLLIADYMFSKTLSLTDADLSKWNLKKIERMTHMFANSVDLKSVDMSGLNTDRLHSMVGCFYMCKKLNKINAEGMNVSNVKNMSHIFAYCGALKEVNISSWRPDNLEIVYQPFNLCKNVEILDLSGWTVKRDIKDNLIMTSYDSKSFKVVDEIKKLKEK